MKLPIDTTSVKFSATSQAETASADACRACGFDERFALTTEGRAESLSADSPDLQIPVGSPPMLFTAIQAAGQLGVSRSTIYELMNSGSLRSIRIGASRRILWRDLIAYVDNLNEV